MRIATWNVNSVRARLERVVGYLTRRQIDVLALQETKVKDADFPLAAFEEAGYQVAHWGLDQYNGVAIASRLGLAAIERGFAGQPTWTGRAGQPRLEARALAASCGPLRLWSLYVPHGRALGDPHMAYKLAFLGALRQVAASSLASDAGASVALLGDWNVAPFDSDVWDITAFAGSTHVSVPERQAFEALAGLGYREVSREYVPGVGQYTYWDYQQSRWARGQGMRIDFAYCSPALADKVTEVVICSGEREGEGASDHVPVEVEID